MSSLNILLVSSVKFEISPDEIFEVLVVVADGYIRNCPGIYRHNNFLKFKKAEAKPSEFYTEARSSDEILILVFRQKNG